MVPYYAEQCYKLFCYYKFLSIKFQPLLVFPNITDLYIILPKFFFLISYITSKI